MGEQLTIREGFGMVLRSIRGWKRMTQVELAEVAKLSKDTISKLERGKMQPNLQTVFILARALSIEPEKMIVELNELNLDLDRTE